MTDFEQILHDMFDHIWDCEIEHPIFDDTVGDLMRAVIEAYNKTQVAQPETITCNQCVYYQQNHHYCEFLDAEFSPSDFCSQAERREE